jgi:hypothetical protein
MPADISERTGIGTDVLLCTLDVRQIRRGILGKRKASGMESNHGILHPPGLSSQPNRKKRLPGSAESLPARPPPGSSRSRFAKRRQHRQAHSGRQVPWPRRSPSSKVTEPEPREPGRGLDRCSPRPFPSPPSFFVKRSQRLGPMGRRASRARHTGESPATLWARRDRSRSQNRRSRPGRRGTALRRPNLHGESQPAPPL